MARRPATPDTLPADHTAMLARQRLHGICIIMQSEHTNGAAIHAWRGISADYQQARQSLTPAQLQRHDTEWNQHRCGLGVNCPYAKEVTKELQRNQLQG